MSGLEWLNVPSRHTQGFTPTPPPPSVTFGSASAIDLGPARVPTDAPGLRRTGFSEPSELSRGGGSHEEGFRLPMENSVSPNDDSISLSLTLAQLSAPEARTYLRWYENILTRSQRGQSTVALSEIWRFFTNFKLREWLKLQIDQLFARFRDNINVGQFFALLRIVGSYYTRESAGNVDRRVIKQPAPIPEPIGILNLKKRTLTPEPEGEQGGQLDLDSFTRMLLGGGVGHNSKKKKGVKFSERLVEGAAPTHSDLSPVDLALPTDQVISNAKRNNEIINGNTGGTVPPLYNFLSFNGSDLDLVQETDFSGLKPLQPNMTGPNEMQSLGIDYKSLHESQLAASASEGQLLKPNRTGPNDMRSMGVDYKALRNLQESGFSAPRIVLGGEYQSNSALNHPLFGSPTVQAPPSLQGLDPRGHPSPQPATPSRQRSLSSPTTGTSQTLHMDFLNTLTGSVSPSLLAADTRIVSLPAVIDQAVATPNRNGLAPPPPPPRTRRVTLPGLPPPPPPRRNPGSPLGFQQQTGHGVSTASTGPQAGFGSGFGEGLGTPPPLGSFQGSYAPPSFQPSSDYSLVYGPGYGSVSGTTGSGSELLDDIALLKQDLERIRLMTGDTTSGF